MTQQGEPREDDLFYAQRALKRAEEFEEEAAAEENEGIPSSSEPSNYVGWLAEGEVPLNVLSELGRIEDEETFWAAVVWYYERAGLHPVMTSEEVAEAIRTMRVEGRPLP